MNSIKDTTYPNSYVVWDLETTDLQPERGEILEIGCIEVEGGVVSKQHQWLITQPQPLSETITSITGITDAMVESEGKPKADVLKAFMEILNYESDRPHITHNGQRFDVPWLIHHLQQAFALHPREAKIIDKRLRRTMIDTAVFVKAKKLNMPRLYHETLPEWGDRVMQVMAKGIRYSIATCIEEMNLEVPGAVQHRALGDALYTNEIYKYIVWPD